MAEVRVLYWLEEEENVPVEIEESKRAKKGFDRDVTVKEPWLLQTFRAS